MRCTWPDSGFLTRDGVIFVLFGAVDHHPAHQSNIQHSPPSNLLHPSSQQVCRLSRLSAVYPRLLASPLATQKPATSSPDDHKSTSTPLYSPASAPAMVTFASLPPAPASVSGASTPTAYGDETLVRNSADDSVPWVIQKYGGTSVGKSLDSITKIVE